MVTKRSGSTTWRSSRVSRNFASVANNRAHVPEGEYAKMNLSSHSLLTSNSQRTTNIVVLSPAPRTHAALQENLRDWLRRPAECSNPYYLRCSKFFRMVRSVKDARYCR